ncbi:MAG: DedA family protein [Verrucomicrobia bacterium]|nr:DedA family protein [Verrucomicrobiota bacterium]MBS0637044.1 DedA family protein [Verrucomicrobiota bacterium]
MEPLLQWLCDVGPAAPLIIFALLVITGFSLPVSEDLLLIASGVLASTVLPEYTLQLFLAAFFGSFISDCIAYGLGRIVGDKIYQMKAAQKMHRLASFYKKYGVLTLVVGRCIPFGIRNGVFMTAGAAKMQFYKFFIADAIACFGFSSLLFYLAYTCGKNYEALAASVHETGVLVGLGVLVALIGVGCYYFFVKRQKVAVS